jgi:AraC family transcriptional regulator, transcriptional activator FtrA
MCRQLDVKDWQALAVKCQYSLHALAKCLGVSPRTLRRHFHEQFGVSPKVWIDRVRAQSVAEQVSRGDLVKTAAAEHYFKQRSHLSNFFKRVTGKAPTAKEWP